MFVLTLTACLGTFVSPVDTVGPYQIDLPDGLEPVDLGSSKRQTMFVARFRRPAPAPDQQVIVSRPTQVSEAWSDGALPPSATAIRSAMMPVHYRPTTWLGGEASLGEMTTPDGTRMLMWAAVRDGWLHEVQCTAPADDTSCEAMAASVRLAEAPLPPVPLPEATTPMPAGPLTVPVPEGWLRIPGDPAQPERVLQAAPPPPTDPRAARSMGHVAVEVFPDVQGIGTWVDALNSSYAETGALLVNQEPFAGTLGEAFFSEYSDGLGTTFTLDTQSSVGMLHVECSDSVARRQALRLMCARVFQGIAVTGG